MCDEINYKVINPYHFIPLRKKRCYEEKNEDLITGKMTIELKTETPLFIPNITSERKINCSKNGKELDKKEHLQYEFFSYHQYESEEEEKSKETEAYEPVIPGSEIRGMIRSIYEAFTCSCMSAIDLDKPLYKRTSDYYRYGILENNDGVLKLYKLDMVKDVVMVGKKYANDLEECQYVTYRYKMKKYGPHTRKFVNESLGIITEEDIKKSGENCGILFKGEEGFKKEWFKVFNASNLGDAVIEMELSDDRIKSFEHVLQTYQDDRINKLYNDKKGWYKEYSKCWQSLKKGERKYIPVYFSETPLCDEDQKKVIYLSPACITKESYYTTLESLLKQVGAEPCKSGKDICPACQLFGMAGEDSISSKLRFSDARVEYNGNVKDYMYENFVTLEELAQPKISATEMYLQRPVGAKFWTYDYYVQDKKIKAYTKANPVKIMGRKFYWHHPFVATKPDKTKRNKSVRLLKKGVKFTEDIYFDGITREQLEQLYFLLNISNRKSESESLHCYKLGSGKPLGLGSISVTVLDVVERKFDLDSELIFKEEHCDVLEKSYEDNGFDVTLKKEFELVTDFNVTDGNKVSYPLTEKQYEKRFGGQDGIVKPIEEGFKWFSENKGGKLNQRNLILIKENLKPLVNVSQIDDVALSCWKETKPSPNNGNGGRRRR
ncbi:TIGR03986 family type III CRISPR-associated RAMP protein [[Clostridium] polysaccharolyticum]|uniref:CRISPR-associated protein n=1 Tax=[Clostridium] polysaccharolyticum TaxID=29364 RepID=A0A1I0AWP6_9FIRM|nr:TIGR03986 family CRISPR-associated RAMP protein [[Clostridium] polysaccharolyticum]SES98000.1 CRISPR-associated protein [[Clostridium] polysaccharolyticum]